MAIFKPSPLIGAISGSTGSATFKLTRNGPVLAKRIIPRGRRTQRQLAAQNCFAHIKHAWCDLPTDDKKAWKSFATHLPKTNALSLPYPLTGYQTFIAHNTPTFYLSLPIVQQPPPLTQLPSVGIPAFKPPITYIQTTLWWGFYSPPHRWYPQITAPLDPVYLIIQSCFPNLPAAGYTMLDPTPPETWPYNNWTFMMAQSVSPGAPAILYANPFAALYGSPKLGDRFAFRSTIWHPDALRSPPYITLGRVVTP